MKALGKIAAGAVMAGIPCLSWAVAAALPGQAELGNPDYARAARTERFMQSAPCRHGSRIASAALIADELLLELVDPSRLVALSYVVDDPRVTPAAARAPRGLPRISGSAEHVLAVRPDLVVISDYTGMALAPLLESAGICVHRVAAPKTFVDVLGEVRRAGATFGVAARAERFAAELEARLAGLRRTATARRGARVLLVQSGYGYAAGTLQHDCLVQAGLSNVLGELGLDGNVAVTTEQLLLTDPDLVFIAAEVPEPRWADELPPGYAWELVRAGRERQVVLVPEPWMASVSHHALAACEAYARFAGGTR